MAGDPSDPPRTQTGRVSEAESNPYPALPAYGAGRSPDPFLSGGTAGPPSAPSRTSGLWTSVVLSIVLNLFLLVGVLGLGWPPGNVFLLFWCENVVLGVCTVVKVLSAQRRTVRADGSSTSPVLYAVFFALHYGIFCLVHLGFSLVVAVRVGVEPTFLLLGLPAILIVVRYTIETATTWFGRGELRQTTTPKQAMMQPYPRVVVLHLSILVAFGLVIAGIVPGGPLHGLQERAAPLLRVLPQAWQTEGVAVVAVLVLIKTVVDMVTTGRALRPR